MIQTEEQLLIKYYMIHDKAFNIAVNPKYHGYQRGLASVFYQFFDKNNTSDEAVKNEIISIKELA